MKEILILILILTCLNGKGQQNICDKIFHEAFYNFVKYDDSTGYHLSYGINQKETCLSDTLEFIHFLLSSRYLIANSNAIKADSNFLVTHPHCYLAHHTNHKKLQPSSDSSYMNSSNFTTIMLGQGSQWSQELPVEVLQLYFVSALYHDDFQFKNEIMLKKGDKVVTTNSYTKHDYPKYKVKTVNQRILLKAQKSYQRRLKIVNEHGLKYVRIEKIDPLSFSRGIEWRNQKNKPYGL